LGNIVPEFNFSRATNLYNLSIKYEFQENSWLLNLNHPDLAMEISVAVSQSTEFKTQTFSEAQNSGILTDICAGIEPGAHVKISAALKLNTAILWSDTVTCVPDESFTTYVKSDNTVYLISHKAAMNDTLLLDTHVYCGITQSGTLALVITPWVDSQGNLVRGKLNQVLYTVAVHVETLNQAFVPLKDFVEIPLKISKVSIGDTEFTIPTNLTGDISEDFLTIIYSNYDSDIAETLLAQMSLFKTTLKIQINGIEAIKIPQLLVEKSPSNYTPGNSVQVGILAGDENFALLVQN
jgi:hypothetical protein